MSRSIAGKIKINSFADLVGGGEDGAVEVPLADLHDFRNHPFRVLDDEKMEETVQSIKEHGVLVPGIARPAADGGYELISGHRRKRGCELAGLTTMPVLIRKYSDDESVCIMVDSNIQREDILPSEKAKAYRMKYEALKHQGSKEGGLSLDEIGGAAGESAKTVQRYIRLSYLEDCLLDMMDEKRLSLYAGVDLSYLKPKEQDSVAKILRETNILISMNQAKRVKELSMNKEFSVIKLREILAGKKAKTRSFTIKENRLKEYFSEDTTVEEMEEVIFRLLDEWKRKGE